MKHFVNTNQGLKRLPKRLFNERYLSGLGKRICQGSINDSVYSRSGTIGQGLLKEKT